MNTQIRKRALFSKGARGRARYWCIGIVGAARFGRYALSKLRFSGEGRSDVSDYVSDRLAEIKNVRDLVPLEMVKPTTRG